MTAVQYAAKCGEKLIQAKAACAHGEWLPWLEANCKVTARQSQRYIRLASEMLQLLDSNTTRVSHFDSLRTAIAYLSASEEVKAQVDQSPDPVTEKQIKELERKHRELEEEKQLLATRSEEWRKQYLAERDAKRALEANQDKVEVEVAPPDYEATKKVNNELVVQLAKAQAERDATSKLQQEIANLQRQKAADV